MKDRTPANPGRVLIKPENGEAAYYAIMTRADNPTQEGDPLNKNTLLKDETAELFGLNWNALPDDVLRVISRFQTGLGNEYLWAKIATGKNVVISDTVSLYTIHSTTSNGTIQYASEVNISGDTVVLVNPTTVTIGQSTNQSVLPTLVGKYIKSVDAFDTFDVVYCTAAKQGQYWVEGKAVSAAESGSVVGYVNSQNQNAYPPAEDDGFTYTPLGRLGSKVKIATGSYKGTGEYGETNKNTLTFDFEPKIVIICGNHPTIFTKPQTNGATWPGWGAVNGGRVKITWESNSVSWYLDGSGAWNYDGTASFNDDSGKIRGQLNYSNTTYNYIAIG